MRTQAEIEREMEEIREYVRNFPTMKQYIEPRRAALRDELRAAMGISDKGEAVSKGMLIFFGLMIAIACVGWVSQ
jgi:hypothetical protein